MSHAGPVPLVHNQYTDQIHSSVAGSHPQHQSHHRAADYTSDQGGSQTVVHQRLFGNRKQHKKHRFRCNTENGLRKIELSHQLVRQDQERNIDQIIEDTRDVDAPESESDNRCQKGTQQLTQSQNSTGIKTRRYNEKIDAHRVNKCTKKKHHNPLSLISLPAL